MQGIVFRLAFEYETEAFVNHFAPAAQSCGKAMPFAGASHRQHPGKSIEDFIFDQELSLALAVKNDMIDPVRMLVFIERLYEFFRRPLYKLRPGIQD